MRFNRGLIVVSLLIGVALAIACGPSGPKVDPVVEAAWAALTEAKEKLDGQRAELDELKAEMMARSEEEAESEDGSEPAEGEELEAMEAMEALESLEEMAARAVTLDEGIAELADKFGSDLAAFLNDPANQIIEGEPLTERQATAVRMKSSEDIELAAEYVEKGGDYRRAVDILRVALQLDPDNADVQAALEETQANRYMSEERFAEAKKGMAQDEIRGVLGQVNLRNIREYPDRGVTAWFYATAEGGAAAAVYFIEDKKSGELKAYQLKYDAVGGAESG